MPDAPSPHDFIPAIAPDAEPRNRTPWLAIAGCVGCGCLGMPLLIVGLGIVGLGGTFWQMVRSSGSYQVYQLAAAEVETNAIVAEALGSPIEPGWISQTKEHYNNESGYVCLRFGVTGANLSGSAYAEAQNIESTWQLHQLLLTVDGESEMVKLIPLSLDEEPLCPDFDDPDPEPIESEPDATEIKAGMWLPGLILISRGWEAWLAISKNTTSVEDGQQRDTDIGKHGFPKGGNAKSAKGNKESFHGHGQNDVLPDNP